jgi:hypothetical protein
LRLRHGQQRHATRSIFYSFLTHTNPLPSSPPNRQGSVEPFTLVEGPEAWYAADYRGKEDHITTLTPQHVAELDAAVQVR